MIDVRVEHVSKAYRVRSLPDNENRRKRRSFEFTPRRGLVWALRDVTLAVHSGEALGVIGPNGSGKTTLVKLLSRVTAPTEGTITLRGRLSALIEMSAGFSAGSNQRACSLGLGFR